MRRLEPQPRALPIIDVNLEFLQTSAAYEFWRAIIAGDEFTCTGGGFICGLEPLTPEQVDQAKDRHLH